MKNSEIAEIIKKLRVNKEEYADEFIDAIWKTIYYLTYKKIKNEQEAEDLTQEIVLYIYTHIDKLKSDEAFYAWMNAIIYGFCNNKMKQLARINDTFSGTELVNENEEMNPEELTLTYEQQEYVMSVIKKLSQKQQDVIFLYYYQQLPLADISEILGCSLNAVKNRLFKARDLLKAKLQSQKDENGYKLHSISLGAVLLYAIEKEVDIVCKASIRGKLAGSRGIRKDMDTGNAGPPKEGIVKIAAGMVVCMLILGIVLYFVSSNDKMPLEPSETNVGETAEAGDTDSEQTDNQEDIIEDDAGTPEQESPLDTSVPLHSPDAQIPDQDTVTAAESGLTPFDATAPKEGRLHIHTRLNSSAFSTGEAGIIFRIYRLNESGANVQRTSQVDLVTMIDTTFGDNPNHYIYYSEVTTNDNGVATITLKRGNYYVVQQNKDGGFNTMERDPFLVSVPKKSSEAESGWIEDVHIYAKAKSISIAKTVGEMNTLNGSYNLLDSFNWTIDITVPEDLYLSYPVNAASHEKAAIDHKNQNIIKFGFIDQLAGKFKYVDKQEAGDANSPVPLTIYQVGAKGEALSVIDAKYYEFVIDADNTLSVYFNLEGKRFLSEQGIQDIRAVFYTKLIISSEEMNKPIYNDETEIDYTNGNGVNSRALVINPPEVHTGKLKITKIDASDETVTLQGAKFKIAASRDNAKNGIFLKRLVPGTTTGEIEDILVTTGTDGTAVIEGLPYGKQGDAFDKDTSETKYYLVEAEAPEGYHKLKEPVEVSVSFIRTEETDSIAYMAHVIVKNGTEPFSIKAGDYLGIGMTAAGVVISGISIWYLMFSKSKKRK